MPTTIQSAYMGLQIPIPTVTLGPAYAIDLNACLTLIDSHNHSSGQGVQVTPNGLDISSDLSFNQTSNATLIRSVRFYPQSAAITNATPDLGCLYVVGNELYYNDVTGGNQVPITLNGSVTGSTGTITGLPSGTASASFQAASGTFLFQQATSTGANIDCATLVIRYPGSYPTPSGNYIAIEAPSSLASGYSLTLPGLPAQTNVMTLTTAGVIGSATYNAIAAATSNANFGGNAVQENGKNIVVANTNATTSLAIVRLYIDIAIGGVSIISGEGGTLVKIGAGQVTVTYTTPFADVPSVCATPENNVSRAYCTILSTSASACTVSAWVEGGPNTNMPITFIAIGQRA